MIIHIVQISKVDDFEKFKALTKRFFETMEKEKIIESYKVHRSFIHEFDAKKGLGNANENKVVLIIKLKDDDQHTQYLYSETHQNYVDELIANKFLDPEKLTDTVRVVDYYTD